MMSLEQQYSQDYYKQNNYTSYLERYHRYERLVHELHHDLFSRIGVNIIDKNILDYGCAVGFLVKAFNSYGYKNVDGYDVSSWAIGYANSILKISSVTDNIKTIQSKTYDLMTALDVFEHMEAENVAINLAEINPRMLIVRIPVCAEDGGKYILDVSEQDRTHKIRWTKTHWIEFFYACGFNSLFPLQLSTIYDTPGVMCGMFINRRWNYQIAYK